jgi:hypothetical protein
LALSVDVTTHKPLQRVCPETHDCLHVPAEHAVPLLHWTPQAPQLALSVAVSTQNPPQKVSPATHVAEQ